jgi:hypothetical protein
MKSRRLRRCEMEKDDIRVMRAPLFLLLCALMTVSAAAQDQRTRNGWIERCGLLHGRSSSQFLPCMLQLEAAWRAAERDRPPERPGVGPGRVGTAGRQFAPRDLSDAEKQIIVDAIAAMATVGREPRFRFNGYYHYCGEVSLTGSDADGAFMHFLALVRLTPAGRISSVEGLRMAPSRTEAAAQPNPNEFQDNCLRSTGD